MEFQLRQGGRAASDFLSDLAFMSAPLKEQVNADLVARGLDAASMPDDLDERLRVVDAALCRHRHLVENAFSQAKPPLTHNTLRSLAP